MAITNLNYASEAEKVIMQLMSQKDRKGRVNLLTTSQIRNILAMTMDIYNRIQGLSDDALSEEIMSQIEYLRVRIIYEAGRERKVKEVVDAADLNRCLKDIGGSRQKFLYLPEEHNDFIFSVVCEELGFIGAALILCLFALLILRGFWIAFHCRDRFSFLVVGGVTSLLAIQVFLNVAVVTNLVPCTGISLPLFSYGGTALLIQLFELGIVLSASRDIPAR